MPTLKRFFNSAPGKIFLVAIILCGAVFSYLQIRSVFGASSIAATANQRVFVCSETGKSFRVTIDPSQQVPVYSPYSHKNTGYPAEFCYWTVDGQIKSDPTPVLVNSWLGKNDPTFCPDCGRLVTAFNPMPHPGSKPPISRAEYEARFAK